MIVVFTFLVLKIVNTRLHLSLGTDPIPEEPEPQNSESDMGVLEGEQGGEGGKGNSSADGKKSEDSKGMCFQNLQIEVEAYQSVYGLFTCECLSLLELKPIQFVCN